MESVKIKQFNDIYDQYFEDVYRFVYHLLGKNEDLEDLVQEIFMTVYCKLHQIREESSMKAWLFSVSYNHVYSKWRKWNRRGNIFKQYLQHLHTEIESVNSIEENIEKRFLNEKLRNELNRLNQTQREIIVLRYIHDVSIDDTARILGKTSAQVRVHTHRALKKLRQNWNEGGTISWTMESKSLNH